MLHLVLNWFFPPIYNRGPSIHIQLQLWSSSGALITTRPNLGVCGRKNKMKVKVTGQGHTISVPWQRSINEALVQLGSKTWNGFCVHAACSTFTAACWGCSTHLVLNLLSFKSINTFLQEAKAAQPEDCYSNDLHLCGLACRRWLRNHVCTLRSGLLHHSDGHIAPRDALVVPEIS